MKTAHQGNLVGCLVAKKKYSLKIHTNTGFTKRIHLVRRRGQCYNYHVYFEMRG